MANYARGRTQSDCAAQRRGDPESKYLSWKNSRPELFRQHQTQPGLKGPMAAAATVTPIAVIADNEEHLVPLPNTVHDATLNRSIISKRKAFATNGRIKAVQPCTFTTTSGECFASSTTITLRWRYGAGLQSYQETFYLVEGCASYDAILRKDIEKLEDGEGGVGKAFPMQFGRPGKKGQDDKRSKEQVKGERDRQCEGEMEMQKAQLRKQMEGMKMPQQKVR